MNARLPPEQLFPRVKVKKLLADLVDVIADYMDAEQSMANSKMTRQEPPLSKAPEPEQAPEVLRLPEVRRRTGLSRTAIYNHMSKGNFPRTIDCGIKAALWRTKDIDDWIAGTFERRQF